MCVGSIRGGGGGRGSKGAGKVGAKGKGGGAQNVGGADKNSSFDKVEATYSLISASDISSVSSESVSRIAKALRSGEISSKKEATRLLVSDILKKRMNVEVQALQTRIVDEIMEDPRLARTLERIWQKA